MYQIALMCGIVRMRLVANGSSPGFLISQFLYSSKFCILFPLHCYPKDDLTSLNASNNISIPDSGSNWLFAILYTRLIICK